MTREDYKYRRNNTLIAIIGLLSLGVLLIYQGRFTGGVILIIAGLLFLAMLFWLINKFKKENVKNGR